MNEPKKPYHHGNLRDELLRIAVRLGKEKGPEAITIRQVTRESGVSPTSAYRHFRDQKELLGEVAHTAFEALMDRLVKQASESGPEATLAERLINAGWAYFHFAIEQPHFFRCIFETGEPLLPLATIHDGRFVWEEFPLLTKPEHRAALESFVSGAYQLAEELGNDVDADSVLFALVSCWSAAHGFTMLCINHHLEFASEEQRDRAAEATFASTLRGLQFIDPGDISEIIKISPITKVHTDT